MNNSRIRIKKSTGEQVNFSLSKLRKSLRKSGADEQEVNDILTEIQSELYEGITTTQLHNRAYALLEQKKSVYASRYKLKKAIYELGPTGFPFEEFIAEVLHGIGYATHVGQIVQGKCVSHEVDIVAVKDGTKHFMECKFHGQEGRPCDVKIPLYIHSRYRDITCNAIDDLQHYKTKGWVVTNTRFTKDAIDYGTCAKLELLSWDYPKHNALKDIIDQSGLYPVTVSSRLTSHEKNFLLSRNVVLCSQLLDDKFYLDHLGVSQERKELIIKEIKELCHVYCSTSKTS